MNGDKLYDVLDEHEHEPYPLTARVDDDDGAGGDDVGGTSTCTT